MPNVTYPGVYISEVSSGVRPVEMASTSTAAFVGATEMGPEEPTRVTSWTEFQRLYGSGFVAESYLAQSVYQYFNNGGRQCYILRVTRNDAALASVTVTNRADPPVEGVIFSAKSKGAWGNSLVLQIEDATVDPGNEFRLSVRRQSDPDVVPADFNETTPLEIFDDLSADPDSARFVAKVLARESRLVNAAMLTANKFQNGQHRSGDNPATPLGDKLSLQINLDGDGFQVVTLAQTAGTADLPGVASEIQTAVRKLNKKRASTDKKAFTEFTCAVEPAAAAAPKRLLLRSGTATATSSVRVAPAPSTDASVQLKLGLALGVSQDGAAVRRPANTAAVQVGDAEVGGVIKLPHRETTAARRSLPRASPAHSRD